MAPTRRPNRASPRTRMRTIKARTPMGAAKHESPKDPARSTVTLSKTSLGPSQKINHMPPTKGYIPPETFYHFSALGIPPEEVEKWDHEIVNYFGQFLGKDGIFLDPNVSKLLGNTLPHIRSPTTAQKLYALLKDYHPNLTHAKNLSRLATERGERIAWKYYDLLKSEREEEAKEYAQRFLDPEAPAKITARIKGRRRPK